LSDKCAPEVPGIGRQLKDLGAGRDRRAFGVENGNEGFAAERQDRVVGVEFLGNLARLGRQITHPEGMGGREGNVGRPGRPVDWCAQGVGEKDGLRGGVARRNLVAGNNRKLPRRDGGEMVGEAIQRARDRGAVDGGDLTDAGGRQLLHNIHWQRQEHRSGRRGLAVMEGATDQNGDLVGMRHLPRPLHRRGRDADEISIQEGVGESVARVLLASGDHEWRSRNAGVQELPKPWPRPPAVWRFKKPGRQADWA
jgi:hypothetical protein